MLGVTSIKLSPEHKKGGLQLLQKTYGIGWLRGIVGHQTYVTTLTYATDIASQFNMFSLYLKLTPIVISHQQMAKIGQKYICIYNSLVMAT